MKFYSFEENHRRRIGVEFEGALADLPAAYEALASVRGAAQGSLRALPSQMSTFISLGAPAINAAREVLAFLARRPAVPVGEQLIYPFEMVKVVAPLPAPGTVLCVRHPGSRDGSLLLFPKLGNAIAGPGQTLALPAAVKKIAARPLLAFVVGSRIRNQSAEEVQKAILGCTLMNDLSSDPSAALESPLLAGNFDGFCPTGPCITSLDELQNSPIAEARFFVDSLPVAVTPIADVCTRLLGFISMLSSFMTLKPGDMIATDLFDAPKGGPLGAGQSIAIEVQGVGRLENSLSAAS